eukprot:COSAG06_NODE_6814_length_2765_cov_1.380720_1_plen_121_part_00
MDEKELHGHLHYRSFNLGTFGSFGKSAWKMIDEVCGNGHPHALDDFNTWRDPDPRRRFILSVGFALQRGNSRTGARGGMFHLGYKLAITAHEVGGERARSGISTRESPGAVQLGGPVSDR